MFEKFKDYEIKSYQDIKVGKYFGGEETGGDNKKGTGPKQTEEVPPPLT